MPLFGFGGKSKDPNELLAQKDYEGAVKGFKAMLEQDPRDINSRLRMADALSCAGKKEEAIGNYLTVAEDYAEKGFLVKAIAVTKKIVKLDPSRTDVHDRLVELDRMYRGEDEVSPVQAVEDAPTVEMTETVEKEDFFDETAEPEETPGKDQEPEDFFASEPENTGDVESRIKTPLFSDFSPTELRLVVDSLDHHACPADTIIVNEGDEGDSMFVIVRGEVSVLTKDPQGNPFELTKLSEGDFFGEVSLLTGKPRTATIRTTSETEFLELGREQLDGMIEAHPEVLDTLNNFYQSRVENTIERMLERLHSGNQ